MASRKETGISQIKSIPGLFISDQDSAQSKPLLKSHHITHVLSLRGSNSTKLGSLLRSEDDAPEFKDALVQKQIDIEDDPTEDIIQHLKDACDWITTSLASAKENESGDQSQSRVLVHSAQGVSRSGTIVIACLMRKLSLDYPTALALAQESRPFISPNRGFSYQLCIWKDCGYDVYSPESCPSDPQEKAPYKAWKSDRNAFLRGGEEAANKARFASMANLAAAFGKKKGLDHEQGNDGETKGELWGNVKKMEEEWTKRLISGEHPPWRRMPRD